ncbi:MAG: hypothetical protein OXT68_04280 [Chloroflexota bacterium]|nr:hypothetical protein [Chloroflexota bacterium]MDE2949964.1 hypothetical protein [Chloroflexota bacterium]
MILDKYIDKIETLDFQIQFSVLSGLSVVEFALSRNSIVNGLLDALHHEPDLATDLYRRIRYLLPQVAQKTTLSYDESIVAYLYCLNKKDLLLAYRASAPIWDTEGLLWSRWLAFKIIRLVQQVEQSLDVSLVDSVSATFSITNDNELVDTRSPATTSKVNLAANSDMIGLYAFEFSTAASEAA